TLRSVRITGFVLDGDQAGDCEEGDVLAVGASCVLRVTFYPSRGNATSGAVTLDTTAGTFDIPLSGRGFERRLSAWPQTLAFFQRFVSEGPSRPLTETFTNEGSEPLQLTVSTEGDDFERVGGDCATGMTLAPQGASCTVVMRFVPSAEGDRTGAITV